MKIYLTQRASLLSAALAPVSGVRMSAVADVPQRPQAHPAQAQAELILTAVRLNGFNGTNGFRGSNGIPSAVKPIMTDGARGVPPRGRPV